ncbi:MAG: DNA polymerase IV [Candidatus Bipolaricaulia bacterium]
MDRIVLHVDMDAFYASVEQRDRPDLRGQPVIVGGQPADRGVVAAASYEARQYGIRSAMPTARAVKLCPHAQIIRGRMGHYREISHRLRDAMRSYTPWVEPLSLDEAYLDLTPAVSDFVGAERLGRDLKRRIRDETQLTCSVGIAPNKSVAKLASDHAKPDGFVVVRPEDVDRFLGPMAVGELSGVGTATQAKLGDMGVTTVAALRELSLPRLTEAFGKWGGELYQRARGIDERPVNPDHDPKQLSRETTFAEDRRETDDLLRALDELAEEVAADLHAEGRRARTVQIKARYADFTTITRSVTLGEPIDDVDVIGEAARLLFQHRVEQRSQGFRLLGVGVGNLSDAQSRQLPLFPEFQSPSPIHLAHLRQALRRQLAPTQR